MTSHLDMQAAHVEIVKNILKKYLPKHAVVYVFGSRVKGNAKKFSDLDLTVDAGERITRSILANISFDLEESDLPYKVDIIDWYTLNENFKNVIKEDRVLFWLGETE